VYGCWVARTCGDEVGITADQAEKLKEISRKFVADANRQATQVSTGQAAADERKESTQR